MYMLLLESMTSAKRDEAEVMLEEQILILQYFGGKDRPAPTPDQCWLQGHREAGNHLKLLLIFLPRVVTSL